MRWRISVEVARCRGVAYRSTTRAECDRALVIVLFKLCQRCTVSAGHRPPATCPRTSSAMVALTEVGGPVHGGGTVSSIGSELVEILHPHDFLAMNLPGEPN